MTIEKIYELFTNSSGVSIDSRQVKAKNLFFAIKGDNFDGNQYAINAINNGCEYAICDNVDVRHEKVIHVENSLNTLQKLATYHRNKNKAIVIGITGTNGKTTTKELIAEVLSSQYKIIYTKGNLNNHIGVPLTLLEIENDTEIAVIEMGANHIGEIDFLCNIANPDYGIVTNVGKAHLEGFGSLEGVIKTKTELYRFVHNKEGKIFVNANCKELISYSLNSQDIYFGFDNTCDYSASIINLTPFIELCWKEKNASTSHNIKTNIIGKYNIDNILAAISIGKYFKISNANINNVLANWKPENNRSQIIEKGTNTIILDAYNANPTSMKAAIDSFIEINHTNKVLIIGDMFELGDSSIEEHQNIINLIASYGIAKSFVAGKYFAKTRENNSFANVEDLNKFLINNPITNALILIKGSRGMKMETILNAL